MKLLIQADDYGITRAVSSGIVFGIHHGLVRNTGIFTNMDWTEECLDMIKPYLDQIDLGIDLNFTNISNTNISESRRNIFNKLGKPKTR